MGFWDYDGFYFRAGRWLAWPLSVVTFCVAWFLSTTSWGFLGFAIGWLPSAIVGGLVWIVTYYAWPLPVIAVVAGIVSLVWRVSPAPSPAPEYLAAADAAADAAATASSAPVQGVTPPPPVPSFQGAQLSTNGLGPLRIGMTESEAIAVAGPASPGHDEQGCKTIYFKGDLSGVGAMFTDGKLSRVTLEAPASYRTVRNLAVGSSAAAVAAAYGADLKVEPHTYVDGGSYLTYLIPSNRPNWRVEGIRYATDASGTVVEILAGGPEVTWVEGCL